MEKNVAASLIPDRDSDSSDDEFIDALEELETADHEDTDNTNNVEERQSVGKGSVSSRGGSMTSRSEVEVDGGMSCVNRSSPTSSHHSSASGSTPRTSQTSGMVSREMPPKFDISLDTDSRHSSPAPNHLFRTPELTPNTAIAPNDSFGSCKTSLEAEMDRSEGNSSISEGTIVEAPAIPPPRPPPPQRHIPSPENDEEALATFTIKNLDTKEVTTLDKAHEILPDMDPLTKHLKEKYGIVAPETDSDSSSHYTSRSTIATVDLEDDVIVSGSTTKKKKFKNLAKKSVKGMNKGISKSVKSISKASKNMRVSKKESESAAELELQSGNINVYPNAAYKNHKPMENVMFNVLELQNMEKAHTGAIWVMKFAPGGKVLASAGDDKNVKIWVLKSQWNHFVEKYMKGKTDEPPVLNEEDDGYFASVPFRVFEGSQAPILGLDWGGQYFLLSAGTDRVVRLWHIARGGQIASYPHPDTVPTVAFHPLNPRYFLSGCLDGKVRLWNSNARKVSSHHRLEQRNDQQDILITTVNFDKRVKLVRAYVGTYDGRITVLDVSMTNSLDYYTSFDIRGARKTARKITSIEQRPNSSSILITSNDSRIRLFDVENSQLTCKYKGLQNQTSQIKGSFSHDGKIIISGDEKNFVYFWETETHYKLFNHTTGKGPLKRQLRRDKNDCYYRFRSHESRVTNAMFAPEALSDNEGFVKEIFVTSDSKGNIKFFLNLRNPS